MKINKILILLFLFCIALTPMSKVVAVSAYVGFRVTSASAPGCSLSNPSYPTQCLTNVDNNWCLPAGAPGDGNDSYIPYGTQMAVTTDASCSSATTGNNPANSVCQSCSGFCVPIAGSSPTAYVTYPTSNTCVNGIVWSGLVNLTSGNNYHVYLYTPNFCPGYIDGYDQFGGNQGGGCFVTDTSNENCCDACTHYGLSTRGGEVNCSSSNSCVTFNSVYWGQHDVNCNAESALMGAHCSSCTIGSYSLYNKNDGTCITTYNANDNTLQAVSCSALPPAGYTRVCDCNYSRTSSSFLFNAFTF